MADVETHTERMVTVRLTPSGRSQAVGLPAAVAADVPRPGTKVVVETPQGQVFASVESLVSPVLNARMAPGPETWQVLRLATRDDEATRRRHEQREAEARRVAQIKIRERGLSMKLTKVEQAFDGSKLMFFFTADERVDFRELVRDLASAFHTRIELRHIGVRDEAQALGGVGTCGRQLCCSTFLTTFAPVSIKMAKQQQVSLSPAKLSGMCGRLKCCLRFELSDGAAPGASGCSTGTSGASCGCRRGGCAGGGCSSGTCGCR